MKNAMALRQVDNLSHQNHFTDSAMDRKPSHNYTDVFPKVSLSLCCQKLSNALALCSIKKDEHALTIFTQRRLAINESYL